MEDLVLTQPVARAVISNAEIPLSIDFEYKSLKQATKRICKLSRSVGYMCSLLNLSALINVIGKYILVS